MSIVRRLLTDRADGAEQRSFNPPVIDWSTLAPTTASGQSVTPENAARSAAVTACQRVLTSSVASLPIDVVEVRGDARIPREAPALVRSPSPTVRRRVFVAQLIKSMTSDGNGYAQVLGLDRSGFPTGMETIRPRDISWTKASDGAVRPHVGGDVMDLWPVGPLVHIPATPFVQPGSPVADSPVELAKEAIGTGLAAERFGAQFFGDGYHPTVIAKSDRDLDRDQAAAIKSAINAMRSTREPGVFGSGLDVSRWEINPEDSQFIDLMRFEVEQACRFFGVPPSMAYAAVSGQNVTYANVSQADLQYLKHSLGTWLLDIEDAWSDLLPRPQRVKFNVDALLRMDAETRHKVYETRLRSKTITVNEIRGLEDEAPFPDPDFDEPGTPGGVATPTEEGM